MTNTLRLATVIAAIGLALIALAGVLTTRSDLAGGWKGECRASPKTDVAAPVDETPAILAVRSNNDASAPTVIELGKPLCVVVANARSASTLTVLKTDLDSALASTAETSTALEQARRDVINAKDDTQRKGADAKVKGLAGLLETQNAKLSQARTTLQEARGDFEVALFLDNRETPARTTAAGQSAPQGLKFDLKPSDDASSPTAASWRELLSEGVLTGGHREVSVGIGLPGGARPFAEWIAPASVQKPVAKLQIFILHIVWIAALGFALLLVAIFVAGRGSTMLRDGDANSSYSLARVQMAFWMIVTIFGFIFIWVVTGQYTNVVTVATFTLLGISGATALASKAIDAGTPVPTSKGFLRDILSDGTGDPKLHRIQIVLWTLVLGSIFVWNILDSLILTDFDANLLLLLGIASGVYAGFKTQENAAAKADNNQG